MNEEMNNPPDELDFQKAYVKSLQVEMKEIEKTVVKREIDLDEILDEYMKAKKALAHVYFLRDKLKNKLCQEIEYLENFKESLDKNEP